MALAEACYRKALTADPGCSQAIHLLRLLARNERPDQGSPSQQASAPLAEGHDALLGRARAYFAESRIPEAIACLRRAIELRPESAQAHFQLGAACEQLGDFAGAAESYRRAVALKPGVPELYCHLGRALSQGGALPSAVESYRRAVALAPNRYEIYNDLGLALIRLKDYDAASATLERALALKPDSAETPAISGYLFECKGDLAAAAESYRRALRSNPKLAPALADLGFVLYGLGELAEAADCFRRLQALQPGSADAEVNLGLIHLLEGNFSLGWREYESRWKVGVGDDRGFAQPRWRGEPLKGASILLYAEQGLGDTLQFVRYVPLVAAVGGRVVLEVQPALRRLLAGFEANAEVIARGQPLPDFQWQCPLLSLPSVFATELGTIPAGVPYILPNPGHVEAWAGRLAKGTFRVGLAWGGNPEHHRDRLRSIPLADLAPLLTVPGVTFYSLQVGARPEPMKDLPATPRLIDLTSELRDFSDTAALIGNLDLVVTVDTAVAHLAGAMGKPVWILLNKGPDWRWLLEHEDSPWYPGARLFRQATPGDWRGVVARVQHELARR